MGERSGLPVLIFHALDEARDWGAFSPQTFRTGMAGLRLGGWAAVSLSDTVARLKAGRALPTQSFVLTFDDGYGSVYEQAFPVLQELGLPATVFLTVGSERPLSTGQALPSRAGRPMLTWEQAREMQRAGIEFGAHTLTHPRLTSLSSEQIEAEMRDSQAVVQDMLSAPVRSFAYPFGRFDRRCREMAQRYFDCACAETLSLVRSSSDPYALERVDAFYLRHPLQAAVPSWAVWRHWSGLRLLASPRFEAYLALRRGWKRARHWPVPREGAG